jgi:formylglycine-generating enzyme required for sulfatase activity
LFAGIDQAAAQKKRFFRISGSKATTISAFRPDGTMVWNNAQPGDTFTVQTVSSLPGGNNWVDYIQLPTTNAVNTNQLIDFNPPAGMAFIPAGVFGMGASQADPYPTSVNVSAFYMDVNLVSYSQWQSVYNWAINNGYDFDNAGSGQAANYPVQAVDWYDVVKWSNARSQQTGQSPAYYTDSNMTVVYKIGEVTNLYVNWANGGYRLPTEAEWEKAARGGLNGQTFPWGDTISESQANYLGNIGSFSSDLGPNGYNAAFTNGNVQPFTSPLGYFAANGYGLYDMAGNVYEWCWDWFGSIYDLPTTNPTGPACGFYGTRVLRGGSWAGIANYANCAARSNGSPDVGDNDAGFRCVRGL